VPSRDPRPRTGKDETDNGATRSTRILLVPLVYPRRLTISKPTIGFPVLSGHVTGTDNRKSIKPDEDESVSSLKRPHSGRERTD